MKVGTERLDLFHQAIGQFLAGDVRQSRNVVDRLFRIELGALPTWPVEDINEVSLEVEQAKLENREEPDRPGADNGDVGFLGPVHYISQLISV